MDPFQLYHNACQNTSALVTKMYSTSFSMGIRAFDKPLRAPIYNIYGFVRFADEIVDTFHDFDKETLFNRFRQDTYTALDEGISLNPILHSFQMTVREFGIDRKLIDAFLDSMEMDLHQQTYETRESYDTYIYGSAEVVGLMCLYVFVNGDQNEYDRLAPTARRLGAAFQKINFLRDIRSDFDDRGRVYFPGVDFNHFDNEQKIRIEKDIQADFDAGLEGIRQLPKSSRHGVYLAYIYYLQLFKKIRQSSAILVCEQRIRVADTHKVYLLFRSAVEHNLNLI
jgi:15-cis-phytoene synthase